MAAEPTELERIARTSHSSSGPTWASALGAVIVVMGVLLTASHATEWMKHSVLTSVAPSGEVPAPSCPKDELEEEGLTVAECEYMVSRLQGLLASTPAWFPGLVGALSALGTLVAFATIFIGAALVSFRAWAPRAAAIALAALLLIDLGTFTAALNAGPIIRDVYLRDVLLWTAIHVILLAASMVGMHSMTREVWSARPTRAS